MGANRSPAKRPGKSRRSPRPFSRIDRPPACTKLRCFWSFHGCGYRKDGKTCAAPDIVSNCSLPRHDLRNGRLNHTAYSLFLFIRDVMDSDLVGWIDQTLNEANRGRGS